jgi:sterol desaturase/sphingolipid hydroxylase (fatty acid hydroxylase superfamily)
VPNPLELLLDPISLTVFGIYAALILLEALFPARPLVPVPGWKWKGLAAFLVFFSLSSYLPLVWTAWLARFQLLDLTGLSVWVGTLVGVVIAEGGVYFWHRSMHASDTLWRMFHQLHHSAERVDTFGAFWFSPMDAFGFTAVNSLCLTVLVGLSAEATTYTLYAVTFLGTFQHTNVRTPQWLGYIVQRPESHSRHHERGVHGGNYSDLPLFDLIFGTFHNPREFSAQAGFYDGASSRIGEMLLFKDVSSPPSSRAAVV